MLDSILTAPAAAFPNTSKFLLSIAMSRDDKTMDSGNHKSAEINDFTR